MPSPRMVGMALITWSCGHFVIRPGPIEGSSDALIASALDDFWFLQDTANEDLANVPTDRHVISTKHCPKCEEPVSVGFWKARAQNDIDTMLYLHEGCKIMYLEIAGKYWKLDFSQKAKFANEPRCALAHVQFWISKTPRSQDPFFAPIRNVAELCDQAKQTLSRSKTIEDVKQAFLHINDAREELGRSILPLDKLLTGVELMFEARSRHRDNATGHSGLPSRESMISMPKTMDFFRRMEDWEDDAMDTIVRLFKD